MRRGMAIDPAVEHNRGAVARMAEYKSILYAADMSVSKRLASEMIGII